MQVTELLENIGQVKEEVTQVDATAQNNEWASQYFKADFNKFVQYYTKETKDIVREFNEFNRRFDGFEIPKDARTKMNEIKQMLKFGQAAYRDETLVSGKKPLSESVQYALRKSWGDYPMYSEFIKELTKDMARLYKK